MKQISDIVTELQALDTTALDAVVAGVTQAIADLQAFTAPAADPVVSITTTTESGATATFVPQA
jgi:hypothetical protein